jgi:hypothetical protein
MKFLRNCFSIKLFLPMPNPPGLFERRRNTYSIRKDRTRSFPHGLKKVDIPPKGQKWSESAQTTLKIENGPQEGGKCIDTIPIRDDQSTCTVCIPSFSAPLSSK